MLCDTSQATKTAFAANYAPCLGPLVEVLATKLRYPPDSDPLDSVSDWHIIHHAQCAQDEVEPFNAYRRDFGETFVFISTYLKARGILCATTIT